MLNPDVSRIAQDIPYYMAHITEYAPDGHNDDALKTFYDHVVSDTGVTQEAAMVASLLLGQYIKVVGDERTPGEPLHPSRLASVGVSITKLKLAGIIRKLDESVKDVFPSQVTHLGVRVVPRDEPDVDGFGAYLKRFDQIGYLSKDESYACGLTVQAGRRASASKKELTDKQELFNSTELDSLIDKGVEAQMRLVTTNLPFVVHVVKRTASVANRGLDFDDLVQEGNLALIDAARLWDPASAKSNGAKFQTYAAKAIVFRMIKAVEDQGTTIRVPNSIYGVHSKFIKSRGQHRDVYGEYPNDEQLAELYGATALELTTLEYFRRATRPMVSLDLLGIHFPEEDTSEETVVGWRSRSVNNADISEDESFTSIFARLSREKIYTALCSLSERESGIIRLRFGLVDDEPKTLGEISKVFGITPERTRQLESKAMSSLRRWSYQNNLRDYLD